MKNLRQAQINFKRAQTRHENEQEKGKQDMSVRQTRRMYNAVMALQHAAFELKDAERDAKNAI